MTNEQVWAEAKTGNVAQVAAVLRETLPGLRVSEQGEGPRATLTSTGEELLQLAGDRPAEAIGDLVIDAKAAVDLGPGELAIAWMSSERFAKLEGKLDAKYRGDLRRVVSVRVLSRIPIEALPGMLELEKGRVTYVWGEALRMMGPETLLEFTRQGDPGSYEILLETLFPKFRKLARGVAAANQSDSIESTDLAIDFWQKLFMVGEFDLKNAKSLAAMLNLALGNMRQIMIDRARVRHAKKRPRNKDRAPFEIAERVTTGTDSEVFDRVLDAVEAVPSKDQEQTRDLVLHHVVAGLPLGEAAELAGVELKVAKRLWLNFKRKLAENEGS